MLIDNKHELKKKHPITVFENIRVNMQVAGAFDFVTGYFTISALARLHDKIRPQNNYRIILGDLYSAQPNRRNIIDIINQKHQVSEVLNLKQDCEKAVEFLEQKSVKIKTVDKNFCHAKTYIYTHPEEDTSKNNFCIVGSSNFTDAGLGLRTSSNIELNKLINGTDDGFEKAQEWFDILWDSETTTKEKIINEEGKEVTCKEFLIKLISDFFEKYSPADLYFKTLYELFKEDLIKLEADVAAQKDLIHLSDSVIFNKLYDFQKKGVMSLIRMLNEYGGAILADAVGLGKTWSALAVMKYFELQGYKVLLLCPKKLSNNWMRFLKDRHSIFEADKFEYFVRYHTDLYNEGERFDKNDGIKLSNFKRFHKLLIVIDESHNLRNDESGRYEFLVEHFYKNRERKDIKTLMLSATPINNKLIDVRNQFKLIAHGSDSGFAEAEGIKIPSLKAKFSQGQKKFNEWQMLPNKRISYLRSQIPGEIFQLVDKLVVARTRKLIKEHLKANIHFPEVETPPDNVYAGDFPIHQLRDIADILVLLGQVSMTAYQPAKYMKVEKQLKAIEDDRTRQKGVARLMHILLIKRLESSWWAFHKTLDAVYRYHLTVLKSVKDEKKKVTITEDDEQQREWIEEFEELEIYGVDEIGKKDPVEVSEITQLDKFIRDLERDCKYLKKLHDNFSEFAKQVRNEKREIVPVTEDEKLNKLIEKIEEKRKKNKNRKIIIFSVFRDTAKYIHEQLKARGYGQMALVTGTENQCDYTNIGRRDKNDFEPIVERFAPFTKIYREKEWEEQYRAWKVETPKDFESWKKIIAKHDEKTNNELNEPIDLLIATDCLSEGQNLQDADCIINYDIHWNPVRLIQRFGRIDRIGSQHDKVYGINFWPAPSMDDFLRLKTRVEGRMAAGTLFGMEVNDVSETFKECLDQIDDIIRNQSEKMFKQLEISWEDVEGKSESFGFAELSYEQFRQELMEQLSKDKTLYENIPNGVYTGFNTLPQTKLNEFGSGIAGLLGYPAKTEKDKEHKYEYLDLFYISHDGQITILNNMEVLIALREHKIANRFVPSSIEKPSPETIAELKDMIEKWMKKKFETEDVQLAISEFDGEINFSKKKDETIPAERYKIDNYDLLTWFVVSKNQKF
ncbi:MAG: DEAD/DEAH box helicase family protein [Bacteroidetes bacterium]|nr:DEAD/DEAH box helicase family protein [Bacteroidota bacterium]